jgi:hypothetical protein
MPIPVSRREPIADMPEPQATTAKAAAVDHVEAFPTRGLDALQGPQEIVRALRPGDSARLGAGVEVDVLGLMYAGRFGVEIARDADGAFRVGFESESGGGIELDVGRRSRVDAAANGKVRLEYRYSTAEDAMFAARSMLLTQGRSAASLGRPAAIEGQLSTLAEVVTELGFRKLSAAETTLAVGTESTWRLELDKPQPELVLRSSVTSDASASLGAGLNGQERWAFLNLGDGMAEQTRLELEDRFTLSGVAPIPLPMHKVTLFTEHKTAGGVVESELSIEIPRTAARAFAAGVAQGKTAQALLALSPQVELDAKQACFTRTAHRYGGAMQLEVLGGGADLTVELRKRTGGD